MNVIDRIRLIICPDPRKWSRSGPIYDARTDSGNYPVIRAMIDKGFLTGDSTGPEPRIAATTWKANDLYMATNKEGVRIRLAFKIGSTLDIEAIHRLAVAVHAEFGDRWNRREKWNR
jgi:hypothetical protein